MPIPSLLLTETNPKTSAFQFSVDRIQGIPLIIPTGAGITETQARKIVSIQENTTTRALFAVLGAVPEAGHNIIGYGVIEEALQTGSGDFNPNYVFRSGDRVTVVTGSARVFQVAYDPANVPASGVASARVDLQGRVTSAAAGPGVVAMLTTSVFRGIPAAQFSGQLLPEHVFIMLAGSTYL